MRTRTKGPNKSSSRVQTSQWVFRSFPTWDPVGWTELAPRASQLVTKIESETMVDSYPGDRLRKPETRCEHVTDKVTIHTTQYRYYQGGYVYSVPVGARAPYSGTAMQPPDRVAVYPDLLTRFLESVDPQQVEMASIPFVAEFAEAARMIRNPFRVLSKHRFTGSKRTPLVKALAQTGLDKTSSAWLEWHYGWVPFFRDLVNGSLALLNASSAYDRYLKGDDQWLSGNVKAVVQESKSTQTSPLATTQEQIELSETFKVTFKYRVRPASGNVVGYPTFLCRKMGLTPRQLLPAAWELIPYSFVADWFLPIGDLLQRTAAIRSNFDLSRVSYHSTRKGTHTHLIAQEPITGSTGKGFPGVTTTLTPAWTCERTAYTRNWGMYALENSRASSGITTIRAMSALSLIAQRLVHYL